MFGDRKVIYLEFARISVPLKSGYNDNGSALETTTHDVKMSVIDQTNTKKLFRVWNTFVRITLTLIYFGLI